MEQQAVSSEYNRIVALAIDNSPHSEDALNYYLEHLKKEGDYVVFIFAPEAKDYSDAPNAATIEKLMEMDRREVLSIEQKFIDLLKEKAPHMKGKFRTHGGKPGEVVCKVAQEESASIIVCGTRGMGTIRRTIMGSVSDYIVHHSHVPVLVCRYKH